VVETFGGDVEAVEAEVGALEAIEEGERRRVGLSARVEDKVVG
jgi:hypothetical protein